MFRASVIALCLSSCAIAALAPSVQANATPAISLLAQKTPSPGTPKRSALIDRLNLSEAQQRQMAAIRQKYNGQMRQLRDRLQASQQEMATLMAGTGSDSAIRAKHQEITALKGQLGNLHLDSMLEMRQVMTPEQRTQFSQLMKERHSQGGQRRGGQDRPPAPPDENF